MKIGENASTIYFHIKPLRGHEQHSNPNIILNASVEDKIEKYIKRNTAILSKTGADL